MKQPKPILHGSDHLPGHADPIPSLGSIASVTDGVTTVSPVTSLDFTSGAVVIDGGSGIAEVAIGAGGASTMQVQVSFDTPDSAGNGHVQLTTRMGFTNVRRVLPVFAGSVDGTWEGAFVVPNDYVSTPSMILSFVINSTSGAVRTRVSTAVVANGVTENTAYTDESYVNTTIPAIANKRFDVTFTLATTPVAGSTINVKITRNGANAADTVTATELVLWHAVFQYVN